MRTCSLLLSALLLLAAAHAAAIPEQSWRAAEGDHAWSFPRDHWAHPEYRIEWWYLTGHLESESEPTRRFGYQFTIFRIGLLADPPSLSSDWSSGTLLMGHAAITDKQRSEHRFSEVLYREIPLLAQLGSYPDPLIAWSLAPAGTDGRWTLRWNGEAFDVEMNDDEVGIGLSLTTRPLKPRILQGPNGLSRKTDLPGAASLYYSFTRLQTRGTLRVGRETWKVRGESWMDQEFSSSQLGEQQVGWDWFSVQLDDGRELMLFELRDRDGEIDHGRGTLVSASGEARYLQRGDWTLRSTGSWSSSESAIVYPSGWVLEIPGESLTLVLQPDVADQENRSRLPGGPSYWEGAVTVLDAEGNAAGRGYAELTGYGENNRPPV